MEKEGFKARWIAWLVWILVSVFYSYQYVLRVMPNILLEDIMTQFDVGASSMGQFSGVYYIGYAIMHLPLGILLDRIGPRKVVTGCILLSVLGVLPLLLASQWVYPVVGRLCVGAGSSAAILGVFKLIRMAFAEKHFSRMLGFSVMIGLLGAIYGGGPLSYLQHQLGSTFVLHMLMWIGVGLAILSFFFIPEIAQSQQGSIWQNVKAVFGCRNLVLTCLFSGFMVGPLEGFADVWGTVFLKQVHGCDGAIAATLPSVIFIGMCFGAPLLSTVAEKLGSYFGAIALFGVMMAGCFVVLLYSILSVGTIGINFAMIGICSAYQILAIYQVSTFVPEKIVGLATAIANMIVMIFGYGFHSVIGVVIQHMGGANSSFALRCGVMIIPMTLIVGAVGFGCLFMQSRKKSLASS